MKVRNMTSKRSGKEVANQFILWDNDENVYFQSYNSLIAKWDGERLTLGKHFDYSVTTTKYLHQFINEYCHYTLTNYIETTPCSSYSKKLEYMVNTNQINYDESMV